MQEKHKTNEENGMVCFSFYESHSLVFRLCWQYFTCYNRPLFQQMFRRLTWTLLIFYFFIWFLHFSRFTLFIGTTRDVFMHLFSIKSRVHVIEMYSMCFDVVAFFFSFNLLCYDAVAHHHHISIHIASYFIFNVNAYGNWNETETIKHLYSSIAGWCVLIVSIFLFSPFVVSIFQLIFSLYFFLFMFLFLLLCCCFLFWILMM